MLGKGGVGKTSVSAALALMAAHRGERVLLMETDPHAPMAAVFETAWPPAGRMAPGASVNEAEAASSSNSRIAATARPAGT